MNSPASTTTATLDPAKLRELDRLLADAEATRAAQLAATDGAAHRTLDDVGAEAVSVAYRETVRELLAEIRLARRKIADGSYGTCASCDGRIHPERLDWRPWATTCTECAAR